MYLARYITRKRGATIGEGVLMPISLAKKVNENLTIENHTILETDNFSSFRYPITIGSHVIIGRNVRITLGSHNIDSPEWEHCWHTDPLIIEDYAWLCPDSTILPGCSKIGRGAVIRANAVAVNNIDNMSVMGDNPAKLIRYTKCVHSAVIV